MPSGEEIVFDYRRLEELIVCLCEKASNIGVTKLEKLLYLCDFIAAEKTGKPITGDTYRHFRRGPVPKHFVPVFAGMQGKDIETQTIPISLGTFNKVVPTRKARDIFSPVEKDIIREVLKEFGHWTAKELVAYVHHDITYKATRLNADIPYALAPYRRYQQPDKEQAEALKSDPSYLRVLEDALL
jgi:uncharacterized phage-associated protein